MVSIILMLTISLLKFSLRQLSLLKTLSSFGAYCLISSPPNIHRAAAYLCVTCLLLADGILGFLPTCLTLPMPQRVTATWIPLHSCLLSPKILHSSLFFISFSHLCASPSSSSCPVIWWEDHSSEIQQTWVSTAV